MTKLLEPATTLDDVLNTLSTEPLDSGAKLRAFYTDDVNDARGGDKVMRIAYMLQQHYGRTFYLAFLMGHQGVGKSTELTRLIGDVESQFKAIRFSATKDLNPAGFKPFDVLLIMLIRLMQQTKECSGREPSENLLRDVKNWLAERTVTTTEKSEAELKAEAEAGVKTPRGYFKTRYRTIFSHSNSWSLT